MGVFDLVPWEMWRSVLLVFGVVFGLRGVRAGVRLLTRRLRA